MDKITLQDYAENNAVQGDGMEILSHAVDAGETVYWKTGSYQVKRWAVGLMIVCGNGSACPATESATNDMYLLKD